MVSRKTKFVIFIVVKNLSKRLIHEIIDKYCKKDIIVYTDEYTIYNRLKDHEKVKKT